MSQNWEHILIKVVTIFAVTTSISLIAAPHNANEQFAPPGGQPPSGGQPNACDMSKLPARCKPFPTACMAEWVNGLAPRGCFPRPGCKPPPECI